ncbi:MAG: VWA domain-containing protein [Rhodospirillales bacterium]|jgi:hypothetical protein|nr:VWA domain-containing protein [Rhodospirillales bacterium]
MDFEMAESDSKLPSRKSSNADVATFLSKVAATPMNKRAGQRGRLIFALDATASRQPTWDRASRTQGEMFGATTSLGGLEIQLAFYRGFGEFRVSPWTAQSAELLERMTSVFCLAGETQLRKVLRHAINETGKQKVNALVFVGDCLEEDVDEVGHVAGELGLVGVPAFMFQEGADPIASFAFEQVARLTNGAHCRLDSSSAQTLRDLLSAVAVFAAGGRPALEDLAKRRGGEALRLVHQVKRG